MVAFIAFLNSAKKLVGWLPYSNLEVEKVINALSLSLVLLSTPTRARGPNARIDLNKNKFTKLDISFPRLTGIIGTKNNRGLFFADNDRLRVYWTKMKTIDTVYTWEHARVIDLWRQKSSLLVLCRPKSVLHISPFRKKKNVPFSRGTHIE